MAGYTTWAFHTKVRRWIPLVRGQTGPNGTADLINRQDIVRRSGEPCKFRLLPDDEIPREGRLMAPVDWDGATFCVDCPRPATHRRLTGMVADTPVYEMVCCEHAEED